MKKLLLLLLILAVPYHLFAQWEHEIRLTYDTSISEISFSSQFGIAADGDLVHLTWWDYRFGNPEIFYKHSTDNGKTWGDDIRLTNDPAVSNWSSIAAAGSAVHIVWVDYRDENSEIYYKRSADGGSTWGNDTRLTYTFGITEYSYPAVAVSGSFVHVVWEDYRDWNLEIYYKRSLDGGVSWEDDIRLTYNEEFSEYPAVFANGSFVHVIWHDYRDGNPEIYYKQSQNNGNNWGSDKRLTIDPATSYTGSIAAFDSLVHLVWCDSRVGSWEVYYKRSSDHGMTWGPDTRLSEEWNESMFPSLAINGSLVHVAWYDFRDGNHEIYYKRSNDSGLTWEEDLQLTSNSAESRSASVAASDSTVHVVWQDNRPGNWEIYYIQNPTGNIIVGETEKELQDYVIYPNPAGDWFEITGIRYAAELSVCDLYGREIKIFRDISSFPDYIDIADLTDGIYILRIVGEDGVVFSQKFIKFRP